MTCCTSILNLGCIYSCDIIQIGINAPASGTYTIELQPDGIRLFSTDNTIATPLIFSGGKLNEDAVSVFKILKPDGTYLETDDGEDCFQVQVKPTVNTALANVDIDPVGCDNCDIDFYLDSVLQDSVSVACGESETINIEWT